MTTGKDIKAVLDTITVENLTNGSLNELWQQLPDHVSGPKWAIEIANAADGVAGYIYDESEEYDDDMANGDENYEWADSQTQDYYSNINRRVQELSLWAVSELDDEVAEHFEWDVNPSLTDLNSHYLYCAMRGLFAAVSIYAYEKAQELSEVNA